MAVRGGKFFQRSGKMAAMFARNNEDSSDDDSDEDEVLSDEEEEEEKQPPAKKRKTTSTFFDEEAEDDEEEDDEEISDEDHDPHDRVKKHYTEDDIRREQMDEEAQELIRQQDRRRAQSGGNRLVDTSVAEMARDIEDRHRMSRRTVQISGGGGGGGGGGGVVEEEAFHGAAVSQQSLVPSVSDPSLWMVSCSTGKEEELVFQIMNKCVALARQGRPLGITSAVAAQSKGRIYVESFSEPAVVEAIQNIRGLMQYSMRLVPIQDMTTVMTVIPKKKPVKKNEWVRMTRGHYKGDLARVKMVRDSGLKCIVQVVPRLDLTLSDLPPEEARIRRKTVRPPQKFFNAQELAALGKSSIARQRFPGMDLFCDYYEGNYYLDGYLLKEVTVGSMIKPVTAEDSPSIEEYQQFQERNKGKGGYDDAHQEGENEGSKMAGSYLDELSAVEVARPAGGGLLIGDTVEVIEGDLVGMRGKLTSLDGTTVKVRPTNNTEDLGGTQEVEFLASQVRKFIQVGGHVKVTDGRYANETGTVVAVGEQEGEPDPNAVVLTDVTNKEITVRISQLRESTEVASGQDRLAGYELYDLVMLSGGGSANEVGVIVRVGREDFTVINNHGIVREVRPEELRGKRNTQSNRAIAGDQKTQQLKVGDLVTVMEGPHSGKTATIKRISRTQLFLYSQTRTENAGIFVVRARSCLLTGSQNQSRGIAADAGASPFSTPRSQSSGPVGGRGAKRDDGLIGKTVRIQAGNWKGYLGTVCDATATHVQVELHSRLKKVMVVRERVTVAGDKFGATEDAGRTIMDVPGAIVAPTTPFVAGGATPMHGGATPLHGGATPMHDSMEGGDEVWRPGGSIDQEPNPPAAEDNDGWGATSSPEQANPFGSPTSNEADNGWGSSSATTASGSTWAPAPEATNDAAAQQQQDATFSAAPVALPDNTMQAAQTDVGDADETTAVWFMERVCVKLKSDDSLAVIKDISNNTATVELESDKSTRTVRVNDVTMVLPQEHDQVLVTGGAAVGVEGELVCIDGTDAILKDADEEFKIVDFAHLAKIVGDS